MLTAIKAREMVNIYNDSLLAQIEEMIKLKAGKGERYLQTSIMDSLLKISAPLDQQEQVVQKIIKALVDAGFTYRLNLDRFGKGGPPSRLTIYW